MLSAVNFVEILFLACLSVVYRGECKSSIDGDLNGSGKYHIEYNNYMNDLNGFHLHVVSVNLAHVVDNFVSRASTQTQMDFKLCKQYMYMYMLCTLF